MADIGIDIISDTTGKSIASKLDMQNALLQVIAGDKLSTFVQNWKDVQRVVREGLGNKLFNVGDYFTDKWIDISQSNKSYDVPWGVRHFLTTELKSGENLPGMVLQWDYCTPFGVQFSHPRAFLKCPDGLNAGSYYFTIENSWGNNVQAGDIVNFTITTDVPTNGRIAGCYYAPDSVKNNWKIYVYDATGKTVLETVTPTFGSPTDDAINLGTMKYNTRVDNLNSLQEMAYGWNRWKTSALRQFLNSTSGVGQWWEAQDEWDIAPEQLTTKAGFLSGVSEGLLEILKPVKITTFTNTVQDGGEADITYDKVFLPSLQELHISPQISGEGEVWDYWYRASEQSTPLAQYGTYPQMITYAIENKTSPQYVSPRSAFRGGAYSRWIVYSSGYVYYYGAGYADRFSPACVIC